MTYNADTDIDVLVVDDEADIVDLVIDLLGERGLSAQAASSAAEAREILATKPVRIVLSDIRMPGESGLDLMGNVRAKYPEIPFFLMTADPGPYYSEIIRSKADGIFIKPFHVERFLNQITAAVQQRKKVVQATAVPRHNQAAGPTASPSRSAHHYQS